MTFIKEHKNQDDSLATDLSSLNISRLETLLERSERSSKRTLELISTGVPATRKQYLHWLNLSDFGEERSDKIRSEIEKRKGGEI